MEEFDKMNPVIIGVVALYRPRVEEIKNIKRYVDDLDYCYLADDSGEDNEYIFKDFIEQSRGRVEYFANPQNIGLCASVNNAIEKAMDKGADWVLIMNPDGTFSNKAINIYKEYLKKYPSENVAIIAPTFNIDRHPKQAGVGNREINYADMTGCLYNIKIMKKIGLFDLKTYFYGLDTEYCMRVKKYGYKIIECSEAVLNHNPAKTCEIKLMGKRIFAYGIDPPKRFYYQFRSAYYIHKKYGINWNHFFMLYKMIKVVLFFDNKKEYFKAINLGVSDAQNGYYGK